MSRITDFTGKSAVENVKEALRRAREIEEYHALLSLTEERALERAAKVETISWPLERRQLPLQECSRILRRHCKPQPLKS